MHCPQTPDMALVPNAPRANEPIQAACSARRTPLLSAPVHDGSSIGVFFAL